VEETEIYAHLARDTTSAAVEKLSGKMQSITDAIGATAQTSESHFQPANVLSFVGHG
jgi:hypothetical protein